MPVTNARYALNAANARWGSLYDALYGTDAIPEDGGATRGRGFNKVRGDKVVAKAREDPGWGGAARHRQPCRCGRLRGQGRRAVRQPEGRRHYRAENPAQFAGYRGEASAPSAVLLKHNGLHLEIVIDRTNIRSARTIRQASPTW